MYSLYLICKIAASAVKIQYRIYLWGKNILGWCSNKLMFFVSIRNPRWPPLHNIFLTSQPIGKEFFLETRNLIETNLCMNIHWIGCYNVFYVWIRNPRWLPRQDFI